MAGGADLYADLARYLKVKWLATIFDVGANTGQTTKKMLAANPVATIHAVEPVKSTFDVVQDKFRDNARVVCHNVAMSSESGEGFVTDVALSSTNKLADAGQPVRIVTGAEFCEEQGIGHVDFLKVDAEGHDLEVLRGFGPMIRDGRVDVIQAEVCFAASDRDERGPGPVAHVPYWEISDWLGDDWGLLRFYDQTDVPLRFGNAVWMPRHRRVRGAELDRPPTG